MLRNLWKSSTSAKMVALRALVKSVKVTHRGRGAKRTEVDTLLPQSSRHVPNVGQKSPALLLTRPAVTQMAFVVGAETVTGKQEGHARRRTKPERLL